MAHLPTLSIGLAAALFCGVSATMNAMFLSSLGRTGTESLVFVALSIAGDVTKATLPVVIVRCLEVRAWGHVSAAAAMLGVVTLLSVASGVGFAATTRSGVVAKRQDVADRRASLQSRRDELATRRAQLPAGRTVRAADAELAHAAIDRRWAWSKQCSEISSASIRQFCSDVLRLKAERAVAVDRDDLDAQVAALQVRTFRRWYLRRSLVWRSSRRSAPRSFITWPVRSRTLGCAKRPNGAPSSLAAC